MGVSSSNNSSLETLINIKITSKQLQKDSTRCEKKVKENKSKCAKYLAKGDKESARIYAENAIREQSQAMNLLRLSSRLDGVASRLQSAIDMKAVGMAMSKVTRDMDIALKSMDTVSITKTMDLFEKQMEDIDVRGSAIETSMAGATATLTPEDEVNKLLNEVADEHGLNLQAALDAAGSIGTGVIVRETAAPVKQRDELSDRLTALRAT